MLSQSFARRVNKLYDAYTSPAKQHIWIDYDTKSFYLYGDDDKALHYKPTKTGLKLHQNDNLVRGIMGAYGSGKTTAMLAEIIFRACQMPFYNNRRYARWAVIRNTYAELQSTTYVSWRSWFETLGTVKQNKHPLLTINHVFNDGIGDVHLEVIFIALDKESDIRKLKSLEVCGIYINEMSEIPEAVFEHAVGRTTKGRYMLNVYNDYWSGVIFDTNPPSERSWIKRRFEDVKLEDSTLYHQPPGLLKDESGKWIANKDADNYERLGSDYYVKMTNNTSEFINVYCLGLYGKISTGKVVYKSYNDDLHSSDKIEVDLSKPVIIGLDFGLTPAAVFLQHIGNGWYSVVDELVTQDMGIEQFIKTKLDPYFSLHNGLKIEAIIGDPSGDSRSPTDLKSCFSILRDNGYYIKGSPSNLLEPRLGAVSMLLNTLTDGKPRLTISHRCKILRDGFLGGYEQKFYMINGEKLYANEPLKNEYSHVHDALQYAALYITKQDNLQSVELPNIRLQNF